MFKIRPTCKFFLKKWKEQKKQLHLRERVKTQNHKNGPEMTKIWKTEKIMKKNERNWVSKEIDDFDSIVHL